MITIIEDTRQQKGKHKVENAQLEALGVNLLRNALPFGDYALLGDWTTIVDSKKDMQEAIGNVCTKEHERFRNECIKARDNGIKLVILIENEDGLTCIDDVRSWKNPRANIKKWVTDADGQRRKVFKYPNATSGESFAKRIETMTERYGVEWEFCKREEAGKKILELLGVYVEKEDR